MVGLKLRKVLIAKEMRLGYERDICVLGRSLVMVCGLGGWVLGNMYCNRPGKNQREAELG